MAKTLVRFENELIDVTTIYRISRSSKFNMFFNRNDFLITVNPDFPDTTYVKNLSFTFGSEELRDKKFEELMDKIGALEHIMIL